MIILFEELDNKMLVTTPTFNVVLQVTQISKIQSLGAALIVPDQV